MTQTREHSVVNPRPGHEPGFPRVRADHPKRDCDGVKIFDRSQRVAAAGRSSLASRQDTGPILVAVDSHPHGWDAVEWGAAEAAARQSALGIVHAFNWPLISDQWPLTGDAFGAVPVKLLDASVLEEAESVVREAAARARTIAPAVPITTHLQEGPTAAAVLGEGRQDALIVLGRGSKGRGSKDGRFGSLTSSVNWQVARLATCPVAIVELFGEAPQGPSAGRVVVGVGGTGKPTAALGFAFRTALRRGVGLTALHARMPRRRPVDPDSRVDAPAAAESLTCRPLEDALQIFRDAFPEVEVRQRLPAAPPGPALVAESAGAALVVVGTQESGRLHRVLKGSDRGRVRHTLLRSARSPVVIVGTPPSRI